MDRGIAAQESTGNRESIRDSSSDGSEDDSPTCSETVDIVSAEDQVSRRRKDGREERGRPSVE